MGFLSSSATHSMTPEDNSNNDNSCVRRSSSSNDDSILNSSSILNQSVDNSTFVSTSTSSSSSSLLEATTTTTTGGTMMDGREVTMSSSSSNDSQKGGGVDDKIETTPVTTMSTMSGSSSWTSLNNNGGGSTATGAMPLRPGETSPSSLMLNRNLSSGIATDPSKKHPILDGRPVIVPEDLSLDRATIGTSNDSQQQQQQKKKKNEEQQQVVTTNGSHASSNSSSKNRLESPLLARRSFVPNCPQSGPARPSAIHDRSASSAAALAITPISLPLTTDAEEGTTSEKGTDGTTPAKMDTGSDGGGDVRRARHPAENGSLSRPSLHRANSEHVKYKVSQQFVLHPSPLRLDAWSEPAAEAFNIRSKTYLKTKQKQPSQPSAFSLLAVDLVQIPKNGKPYYNGLCSHPSERIQQALKRERETGVKELPPFVFAVNLVVPGQVVYHSVCYFGCDAPTMTEIRQATTPFGKVMNRFVFAPTDSKEENELRNDTFKLIPRIVEGNFIVRKTVGSKPALLGKKIIMKYIRDPSPDTRFFEVMVDIASDPVAERIVKLALGYIKTLTVDMAFCLEGKHPSMLPERIFGVVRMKNLDFKEKDGKRVLNPS